MVIGDVNGSGDITDNDEEVLVKAINKQETVDNSDLNRDARTDLADLQFFAKGYVEGKDKETAATVKRKISPLLIKVELEEGTALSEESDPIEELFNEEKEEVNVLLQPAKDGAISEDNAVGVDIDPSKIDFSKCDGIEIQGNIKEAFLEIITEEKSEAGVPEINEENIFVSEEVHGYSGESVVTAHLENGKIKIDLGNQVAVKKITLKITAVQVSEGVNNLAQISKVEFLNGMENRISEPELDYPTEVKATAGNMKITASWAPCVNVTEYEIEVATDPGFKNQIKVTPKTLTVPTASFESEHGNFKLIKNYTTYYIHVRSVNGDWKSKWSDTITAYPKPTGKPDKPDMVKASGGFQSMKVSWNADNTNGTQLYKVFYRVRGTQDEYQEFTTTGTSCDIVGLKDFTEYEVYVVGYNEHGDGTASNITSATTTSAKPPILNRFGVINQDQNGVSIANIKSITITDGKGGEMVGSQRDDEDENPNTAWGVVDNDPSSYYKAPYGSNGLTIEFDQAYDISSYAITIPYGKPDFFGYTLKFYDGDKVTTVSKGNGADAANLTSNGASYRVVTLSNKVRADKIEMTYSSMNNLYVDDLHTVLQDDVNEDKLSELQAKIDAPDEFGNNRTNKKTLDKEIETARKLLNAQKLNPPVKIHKEIANNEAGRNFSGLNAW